MTVKELIRELNKHHIDAPVYFKPSFHIAYPVVYVREEVIGLSKTVSLTWFLKNNDEQS